jgi:antirestriction protein ArdC
MEEGFSAPISMTYKQSQELGGQVRKGEKGSLVIYLDNIIKKEEGTGD